MEVPTNAIGTVATLWRYPVKSMQGEQLQSAPLTERGILGDRAFALVDQATGKVASAKHPGKWSTLFACRAAFVEAPQPDNSLPPVAITLPDGTIITSDQPDVDDVLSRLLGRDVALVTTAPPEATFEAYKIDQHGVAQPDTITNVPVAWGAQPNSLFNYAAVHLLTSATLEHLQALYPDGAFDVRRFRPNIVVSPAPSMQGFVENDWIGHNLVLGERAQLHVIDPCPRCVVTTLAYDDLPHDPRILRTVAQHNAAPSGTAAPGVMFSAVAGVYARVVEGGALHQGEVVRLAETGAAAL